MQSEQVQSADRITTRPEPETKPEVVTSRMAGPDLARLRSKLEAIKLLIADLEGDLNQLDQPAPGSKLVVLQGYKPSYIDELSLTPGQVIEFLEVLEPGWWKGRIQDQVKSGFAAASKRGI